MNEGNDVLIKTKEIDHDYQERQLLTRYSL